MGTHTRVLCPSPIFLHIHSFTITTGFYDL